MVGVVEGVGGWKQSSVHQRVSLPVRGYGGWGIVFMQVAGFLDEPLVGAETNLEGQDRFALRIAVGDVFGGGDEGI